MADICLHSDQSSGHDETSEAPPYSEHAVENLTPTTPRKSGRYDRTASVVLSHMVLAAGSFNFTEGSEPAYLPEHWKALIHPEGQPYFYRISGLRVLTEANLYEPKIMDKVDSWAASVENALLIKDIPLVNIELLLEPCDDLESCEYYLVDHATRSTFWIDQVSSEKLNLAQVASITHFTLESLYWIHVEYFPVPPGCLSSDVVDELISVFSHGQTDKMTSSTSTFPYSVDECIKFIQLLKDIRERHINGHIICLVARLWCNIIDSRFSHHFGQQYPRLCRDQSILGSSPDMDHWIFRLGSSVCFELPKVHYSRLKNIFVDHEVDISDFRETVADCLDDWKSSLSWNLPLLLSNVLLLSAPAASQIIGLSSVILSGVSAMSAMTLSTQYQNLLNISAGEAYMHIKSLRSANYGFRLSALMFSLPRALCFWGLALLILQAVLLTSRLIHTSVAIGWAVVIMLLFLSYTTQVLSEDHKFSACNRVFEDVLALVQRFGRTFLGHGT